MVNSFPISHTKRFQVLGYAVNSQLFDTRAPEQALKAKPRSTLVRVSYKSDLFTLRNLFVENKQSRKVFSLNENNSLGLGFFVTPVILKKSTI